VLRFLVPVAIFGVLALVPTLSVDTGGLFASPLDSPGTLQLLGLCLVFGGLALTYDLLFGFTGLLSFGHALYFAIGVYVTNIAITHWGFGMWAAFALTAAVGLLVPLVVGAISLRVSGIAFAMVTLAFAQAGSILVSKNPDKLTGGEEGLGLDFEPLPDFFVGVLNTKNLYWTALAYLIVVCVVSWWAVASSPGRVWQAIRENEQRVEVLGLRPFSFKLIAFVVASFLATIGGVVYLLLIGGSSPEVTTANFTLTLLLMVVIGGTGTRWGAVLGGILYTYLDNRLLTVAGSNAVQDLPGFLRTPLSEPLFVLGVIFILIVYFFPGGLVGLSARGRRRGRRLIESSVGRRRAEERAGAGI
jgi:branched-chain amino acid transport system permease protein